MEGKMTRAPSPTVVIVLAATLLAGCSRTLQTTSGAGWLNSTAAIEAGPVGDSIRRAAALEPNLRFPARIGIARIGPANGKVGLSMPSAQEAASWARTLGQVGPEYGEFVPISPFIAALVEAPAGGARNPIRETIELIRIAAAHQHLDAVLIYEVDATADANNTPLSIAEWTLIGAFMLPTQNVKVQAVAQAMLVDVRNGYHYGGLHASTDDNGLAPRFSRDTKDQLVQRAKNDAVDKLAVESEVFFRELRTRLSTQPAN
jgi:hypothetical protein